MRIARGTNSMKTLVGSSNTCSKITLAAVDGHLVEAFDRFCGDLDFVRVHNGSIFDIEANAYVSPANSFGFMDGGIDMAYTQRFGWDLQDRLQKIIRERHHGELLVGAAEIVETNSNPPFLIAAPTMRVPMILRDSINPYLAARAVFLTILHGTFSPPNFCAGERVSAAVDSVAFPGMGSGIGQIGPNTCARQIRAAIDEILLEKSTFPATWADASLRHQALYTDRPRNLQRE
jgi:O-acetyl-ADP-ribose deacetylase (regulator of RNase III)